MFLFAGSSDQVFNALGTYTERVGQTYFDPNYITDAPRAEQWYDYYANTIPMGTTVIMSISAPAYGWKANMLYPTSNPRSANYGNRTGQAPTQGVYTGVNSGCGANGVYKGGNNY